MTRPLAAPTFRRHCFLAGIVRFAALAATTACAPYAGADDPLVLTSPDGRVVATVQFGDHLHYEVAYGGVPVVLPSRLGPVVDGVDLGGDVALTAAPQTVEHHQSYPTRGVHVRAENRYRETAVDLIGGDAQTPWQLELRVYNDGFCCRYRLPIDGAVRMTGESTEWTLPEDATIWRQSAENKSYEAPYVRSVLSALPAGEQLMAPAVVQFADNAGYALTTEANLRRYSDMALEKSGANQLRAVFLEDPDGWDAVGPVTSPWRVTLLAPDLNALVNSDVIRNLCEPPAEELANAAWIRPGRSTWHWLTGGAPVLEDQKQWIDRARQLGVEYHLVDDGWRTWNGGGDAAWDALAELVEYARRQEIGVWAWVHARYVTDPAARRAYFRRAKEIGVAGLKIDFPQPAGYQCVCWYEDVLSDAAASQLMVNFHGCVKPTGLDRTWPLEMTREAIRGREQGKNPSTHDTTLPFVRCVQGHADYTPTLFTPAGASRSRRTEMGGSSYAHELAMAVAFTSPYLCLGDDPRHYLASEAADLLRALPAVWDETIVLPPSAIGELVAVARRRGDDWYVGVINGSEARQLTIPLDFLDAKPYELIELGDSDERSEALVRTQRTVGAGDRLAAPLRSDGGYVGWLQPAAR